MHVAITGAGQGIGRAIAEECAARGHIVTGLSRRSRQSGSFTLLRCDVRKASDLKKAFTKAVAQAGPVDVLVNCAGVTVFREFLQTSEREFDEIIRTNLVGTMLATKCVLPAMIRRRTGMIVNIVSYAAKTVYTASSAYSASKAGVTAMMNSLREEVRGKGVRVVNVFPGAVETNMWPATLKKRFGKVMMPAAKVASIICDAIGQPEGFAVEELVIRPQVGDLRV